MEKEPSKNFCHKCHMFIEKDESLDCFACGLSCRCLDCVKDINKYDETDGTFKYLCPQCIRKRRGPKAFYERYDFTAEAEARLNGHKN